MKRVVFTIFIVLFSMAISLRLFLYVYEYHSIKEQSFYNYTLSPEEYKLIEEGDIILRHGYGLVSDIIVEQLHEKYDISHCAIICKTDTGFAIVHSVSSSISNIDGVQAQDLKSFVNESQLNSVIILRYKPKIEKPNSCISNRAVQYLTQQVPFDESFDINDSSEFYCTELLWKVFLNEFGDDIFLNKNKERNDHIKFELFLDEERFQVIINHHLRK